MAIRRLDRPEDRMRGVITYDLGDGQFVQFDARAVADYGIEKLLKHSGIEYEMPTGRVPVVQHGKRVGSVPATFDPVAIKSTSFFYEPRGGDFVREGDAWVASRTLGPGDLEAVPGFVWERG